MLPHVLSSDACSLAPRRDRLAVTSEIEISEAGEPLSASFYRSLIRSDVRLDYDGLDEIFAGRRGRRSRSPSRWPSPGTRPRPSPGAGPLLARG